jgi:hypothetical protein
MLIVVGLFLDVFLCFFTALNFPFIAFIREKARNKLKNYIQAALQGSEFLSFRKPSKKRYEWKLFFLLKTIQVWWFYALEKVSIEEISLEVWFVGEIEKNIRGWCCKKVNLKPS